MDENVTPRATFLTRMQTPSWQQQLRASVHLYLELGAAPSLAQECDELLQRTEAELLNFLLAGAPPTAAERQRAQFLLDLAQHALLDSAYIRTQQRGAAVARAREFAPEF